MQKANKAVPACQYHRPLRRSIVQSMEICVHSRLFLARYRGCTNAQCILSTSYGHEEFKNVNPFLVQKAQKSVRAGLYHRPLRRSIVQSMEIRVHSRFFLAGYRGCNNARSILSRNYGHEELYNVNPISVQKAYRAVRACKYHRPLLCSIVQSMEIRVHSRLFLARYKGCTNARCILSRRYGHEEFKNINPFSVQKAHKAVRACQYHLPMRRSIVESMDIRVHSQLFLTRYKGFTNARYILSRSYGHEEFKNVNPSAVQMAYIAVLACQYHRPLRRSIVQSMESCVHSRLFTTRYKGCTNARWILSRSYWHEEFKNVNPSSVQTANKAVRACQYHRPLRRSRMQSMEIRVHSRLFPTRYNGYTNARCILSISYGHEEFKNVNPSSVQMAHKAVRVCQYHRPLRRSIVQSMEIRVHSRLFIARYRGCTNPRCLLSRSYGHEEIKNVNPISVQ